MSFGDVVSGLSTPTLAFYRLAEPNPGDPILDSSGNGHTGEIDSGFYNPDAPGLMIDGDEDNRSIYFGGTGVYVPYNSSFNADYLSAGAVLYTNNPGGDQWIVGRAGAFSLELVAGRLEARVTLADTTELVATSFDYADTAGVGILAVMTYDGTTLRLYENSVEVGSASGSGVVAKPTTELCIAKSDSYDRSFSGLIDEIVLWDGVITESDVRTLAIASFGLALEFTSTSLLSVALDSVQGDDYMNAIEIGETSGTVTVDASDATIADFEDYETPAGADRNIWLHYFPAETDDENIRFWSSHPDAAVVVYDFSGGWPMSSDLDGDYDDTLPLGEYLIQVAFYPGNDHVFTLSWETVPTERYSDPETPMVIASDYGSEDVNVDSGLPAWLTWEADNTADVEYVFSGTPDSVNYTVTIYLEDKTTVVTSASGAGVLALTVSSVVDTVYFMEITAVSSVTVELSWSSAPVIEDPAPPYEYIRVEVYEPNGLDKISEIPRRSGVQFMEPLNEVGAGEFTIRMSDPLIAAYDNLLDWGNVVKFWLGDTCVHGFRIKQRSITFVSTEEWSGFVRRVAGPSVHHMLDDFQVRHNLPLQDRRLAERGFFWGSLQSDDLEDDWYRPGKWNDEFNASSQDDPPSFVATDMDATEKPKYGNPPNFPDGSARWLWISSREELNTEEFNPPALEGVRYYRKDFSTSKTEVVRVYASADERYTIYLDGEELLSGDGHETGYNETQKRKFIIRPGRHTLAVKQRTKGQTKGDGVDAFIMTLMRLNAKDKPTSVIVRTNDTWKTTWERPVPTWNRAYVLRTLIGEAQARGVEAAGALNIGFTGRRDSRNNRWTDRFDEEVTVGQTVLELQGALSEENGFDVWVDPETMTVKAWNRRGKNRSTSVTLEAGRNLMDFAIDETDNAKNDFLIQYDGGWTRFRAKSSKKRLGTREAYLEIGHAKNDKSAERIVRKASNGVAWAQKRAGTSDIVKRPEGAPGGGLIAVDGARPFLDFGVGDTIKAPNARGVLTKHRVMALSCSEDADGILSYDPELEEVD